MPTHSDYVNVARQLKTQLNGFAFKTVPRIDITSLLRDVSGEDNTRIKAAMGEELERALLEQGVRCYPHLKDTSTPDTIRLFHAGSVLGNLVDLLLYPSVVGDKELADTLTKVKGKWEWSKPTGPAALVEKDRIAAAPTTAVAASRGGGDVPVNPESAEPPLRCQMRDPAIPQIVRTTTKNRTT